VANLIRNKLSCINCGDLNLKQLCLRLYSIFFEVGNSTPSHTSNVRRLFPQMNYTFTEKSPKRYIYEGCLVKRIWHVPNTR